MLQEVTEKELITVTIDKYTDLQRIKKANGNTENSELDYQIRIVTAKLSSMGVNVEDLTNGEFYKYHTNQGVKSIESSRALHFFRFKVLVFRF